MKHPGSTLRFLHQRNAELMRAYRRACSHRSVISLNDVAEEVVNSPCSRFWVSEDRAWVVFKAYRKGKPVLDTMHPSKQEMFREIFRRASALHAAHPSLSLFEAVTKAVNSPAPKFYMQPRSAIEIIHKIKRARYLPHPSSPL